MDFSKAASIIRKIALCYGVICLGVTVWLSHRIYQTEISRNATWYESNRNYTMSLFFPKWEDIGQRYDTFWNADAEPKWYEQALDPTFQVLDIDWQKSRGKEYIRKYVKRAAGIDHRKVEAWLNEVIDYAHSNVYSFADVFGQDFSSHSSTWEEAKLRQAISMTPLHSHWYIFKETAWIILLIFPVLMGIPLFLVQLICWGRDALSHKKSGFLYLTNKSLRWVLLLSAVVSIIFGISVTKAEYETAVATEFVSGKWFFMQMGAFACLASFLFGFLGFWSLKVLKELCGISVKVDLR